MKSISYFAVLIFFYCLINCSSVFAQKNIVTDTLWQTLAPGVISLPGIGETSPSMTADGLTMVFARTKNWGDKVPFIATRKSLNGNWSVEQLPIADTLYNLAITPDGSSIFFKQYDYLDDSTKVSRVFRADRTQSGWSDPGEMESLYNINAGYFYPMANGRLYYFARPFSDEPGGGNAIFYSDPQPDGSYSDPEQLSEKITSFDVMMHEDEDKLIIPDYISDDEQKMYEKQMKSGFYYYEKHPDGWGDPQFIEQLPYGWGPTLTPDGKFIFVDAGDLQIMEMADLGLDW